MSLDATIAETLEKHTAEERSARTWRVSSNAHGGAYWFDVTWIPGSLVLTGDLHTLIITHAVALREFCPGVGWIAESDIDYLLGKSNQRRHTSQTRWQIAALKKWAELVIQKIENHRAAMAPKETMGG